MHVGFLMQSQPATLDLDDTVFTARWLMVQAPGQPLFVARNGTLVGAIPTDAGNWDSARTLEELMTPVGQMPVLHPHDDLVTARSITDEYPEWSLLPVVASGRLLGVVAREALRTRDGLARTTRGGIALEELGPHLLDAMFSGVMVIDDQGIVQMLNRAGAETLGTDPERAIGRPYEELAALMFPNMLSYLRGSAIPEALAGRARQGERRLTLVNGREVLFRFGSWDRDGTAAGVIVTFMDITELAQTQKQMRLAALEAEAAFSLSLPNSKVEVKLKSSPEYEDIYDPAEGTATVTRVVPDGTYRHVINGLRLMAELKTVGVMDLVGIDKDALVQAFIFHDLGKEQPTLAVGDRFVPHDTFEPGARHAARSADWAVREYHLGPAAEMLVRHHHTPEPELPDSFPPALLPMLRIFKLVDGLSAALTRRQAKLDPFVLQGTRLIIGEQNRDSRYHRRYELAIFSGHTRDLPWEEGEE